MSRRTRSRNAFETELNGLLNDTATTIPVISTTGLTHPCWLVIDPNDAAKREYIKVGGISGSSLTSVLRGQDGSSAGAQEHETGAKVRAVPVHQHLDDIFSDVEDLEGDVTALQAADTAHFAGTDVGDHPEATPSVRGFMSAADKTKLDTFAAVGTYATDAELAAAVTAHEAAGNPHSVYALDADVTAAVAAHEAAGNPHAGYATDADLAATDAAVAALTTLVNSLARSASDFDANETGTGSTFVTVASVTIPLPAAWTSVTVSCFANFHIEEQVGVVNARMLIEGVATSSQPMSGGEWDYAAGARTFDPDASITAALQVNCPGGAWELHNITFLAVAEGS